MSCLNVTSLPRACHCDIDCKLDAEPSRVQAWRRNQKQSGRFLSSQYMLSYPRTKTSKYVTQVVPACLSSSGLLDCAINTLQKASCPEEPITMAKLAAVHVLGGTLSLSKGRGLFPRPAPTPGPAPAPAMVSSAHLVPTFCPSSVSKACTIGLHLPGITAAFA